MSWFNPFGLIVMAAILFPNILYAAKGNGELEGGRKNKVVETLEQIGRYGCMMLMVFNIPYTYVGFWFADGFLWYIAIDALLVSAYGIVWVVCLSRNSYPLSARFLLAALPSAVFLFSGVMLLSAPLLLSALLFAPCHIGISCRKK